RATIRMQRPACSRMRARDAGCCCSTWFIADSASCAIGSGTRVMRPEPASSVDLLDAGEHPAAAAVGGAGEVPDLVERLGRLLGGFAQHALEAHARELG